MDALSLQVTNSEFEQYRGKQNGRKVNNLLDKVMKYNRDFKNMPNYSIGIYSNDSRIGNKIGHSKVISAL